MNTMMLKLRIYRSVALFLVLTLLAELALPVASYALTSGPSQPEVQSFEAVSTTEMVDLFSGDFTYNIPLFELPGPSGGYPLNLHYNSGISMDQEASWVGLGWNLNPGAITRQMRGLPDEYDGRVDKISHIEDMKPNVTYGVGAGGGIEIGGGDLGLGLSAGISIYYNSYKGVGYSLDQGMSITHSINDSKTSAGIGMSLSMDSQEGVGVNASLSLTQEQDMNKLSYNLGVGLNSRSGAQLSLGMNIKAQHKHTREATVLGKGRASIGGSSVLSFHSGGYMPSAGSPMSGKNISLQFKVGGQIQVFTPHVYVSGFYASQSLKNRGLEVSTPAYGYLNLHHAAGDSKAVLDFNREGDGMIRKNSPNMAMPSLTSDIYSVSGHGIAGMYRAFRNDVAHVHDPYTKSETVGGALGIEAAVGLLFEIGGDASVNYSKAESGKWNELGYTYSTTSNALYEPSYFKTYGEHTSDSKTEMDYIGGEKPVRVKLNHLKATNQIETMDGLVMPITSLPTEDREPRNVVINYINNDPKAGMYAINADGSRYYYKAASNNSHVEYLYASGALNDLRNTFPNMLINDCGPVIPIENVDGKPKYKHKHTNEYFKKTSMPSYAYAYLIDYIVGPDYVDVDGDGKPSDSDMGYWIKFNYNEKSIMTDLAGATGNPIPYNWRNPFAGANYIKGSHTTFEDDKGSFTFGNKDVYYLTSIVSKTHIAKFYTSKRKDGRGANAEIQNSTNSSVVNPAANLGAYSRKLDRISLYSKLNQTKPIKSVYFEYTYDLCKKLYNNDGTADTGYKLGAGGTFTSSSTIANAGGKLTLKRLWFTYEHSTRGSLNPYFFDYHEDTAAENPDYNPIAYDRWGNYKPINEICEVVENPYVRQFIPSISTEAYKENIDKQMSVWNMKSIKLPSGATISIQYEADDYAYVQNKQATQMFQIQSVANNPLTDPGDIINHPKNAGSESRKVYFNLETPIPLSMVSGGNSKKLVAPYFEGIDKLYFKTYMYITDATENKKDYVSGYVDIDDYNIDLTSVDNNHYTRAYVVMGKPRIGKKKGGDKSLPYHPFSMAAWQHIRTNVPTLTYAGSVDASPDESKSAALAKVKSLTSMVGDITTMFRGFNNYAFRHKEGSKTIQWGKKIVLDKSYIKLNSPDKKKYGGGSRVRKIVLDDSWSSIVPSASNSEYGQVYEYTIEENGREVSSGVASYEPALGGDENPLKKAKEYVEAIPLKTNNNLFFEYPINEGYYPGASVGYRKVTVKSLATHYEKIPSNTHGIPAGILTTGATVHEFYTAKEFPVLSDETTPKINFQDIYVPIPLIGQIKSNKITASQGYSTVLNDMHGKLKKMSTYKQDAAGNIIYQNPESYVEYLYNYEIIKQDSDPNNDYYKLVNAVDVLRGDKNGIAERYDLGNKRLIGQDYEYFVDSRHSFSVSEHGGIKLNTDGLYLGILPLPIPLPWPGLGRSTTEVNIVVTNKIIHKSGILKGIKAYNGGVTVYTNNVLFDDLTGEAILTTVTNSFDDPIFDYNIPAHFAYEATGPAYKNIGLKVTVTGGIVTSGYEHLVPGDELVSVSSSPSYLVYVNENNTRNCKKAGVSNVTANTGSGTFVVIRSGRRNMLQTKIGNIKTLGDSNDLRLGDPTINSNRFSY